VWNNNEKGAGSRDADTNTNNVCDDYIDCDERSEVDAEDVDGTGCGDAETSAGMNHQEILRELLIARQSLSRRRICKVN
jgi:hypothetical protein